MFSSISAVLLFLASIILMGIDLYRGDHGNLGIYMLFILLALAIQELSLQISCINSNKLIEGKMVGLCQRSPGKGKGGIIGFVPDAQAQAKDEAEK